MRLDPAAGQGSHRHEGLNCYGNVLWLRSINGYSRTGRARTRSALLAVRDRDVDRTDGDSWNCTQLDDGAHGKHYVDLASMDLSNRTEGNRL